MPEELWTEVHDIVQEAVIKTIPKKKKCKMAKWLSQEAGKAIWYSHGFKNLPQFYVIHTVKGFSVVNETEVDTFLEFSCFVERGCLL